jgi:hypothetical protein
MNTRALDGGPWRPFLASKLLHQLGNMTSTDRLRLSRRISKPKRLMF